jgi:hypothetical protein
MRRNSAAACAEGAVSHHAPRRAAAARSARTTAFQARQAKGDGNTSDSLTHIQSWQALRAVAGRATRTAA